MALIRVAQVEVGNYVIFNSGRKIGVQRVTTTAFLHLESLIYNVYDHPVDQQTGKAITVIQPQDYASKQHNEGALTMGSSQMWSSPKEYNAVSDGEIVQWTVSVPRNQPQVNDNAGPFKFVTIHIEDLDLTKFFLKKTGETDR